MMLSQEDKDLIESAKSAIRKNYDSVRWWHTVGAAVRTGNGKVYTGVNCDSVSHGACAEVIAIGSAVTAGEREFDTIVAVLGGEIQVPTLNGAVSLKIPEGTQPGTVFRLRGKGVKNIRTGKPGDILVEVKLVVPTNLTEGQKDILRSFGDPPVVEQPSAGNKKKNNWSQKVKDFFD